MSQWYILLVKEKQQNMNQLERQLIHRNMDQLILNTNYDVLKKECFIRCMMSEVMIAIIEERNSDETSKHKKLFEKITKRGPTAFTTLLEICQQNFPTAYTLLKSGSSTGVYHNNNSNNNSKDYRSTYNPSRFRSISASLGDSSGQSLLTQQQRLQRLSIGSRSVSEESDAKNNNTMEKPGKYRLEEFTETVERNYEVKITGVRQFHKLLEAYPMRTAKRGVIFIANIITYKNETHPRRNGAETDKDNLVSLFRQLGFTVFYYEDLCMGDFMELIKELKTSDYLSTECFAFYIMAHGNHTKGRDKIYLQDNSVLYVEDILNLFNNANCPKLIRKPKMFFFSICRGDQADHGTLRAAEHTERDGMINPKKDPPTNMPTYADMFICFSTVPGFAAHRDKHKGSWFVESMCEVWAEHAHELDVEQLMKLVGKKTSTLRTEQSNALQTLAGEHRGFFDLLYLNPGYIATKLSH